MIKFQEYKILIICLLAFFISACEIKQKQYKDFYIITVGGEQFRIPVDYIAFEEQRKDGEHRYVPTVALIPDLNPIENMRHYYRPPTSTSEMISFDLSEGEYNLMRTLVGYQDQGFLSLPNFSKENGLVYLGVYKVGGKQREKIYVYVKDGLVFARFHCGMSPDYESPACAVSQKYNNHVSLNVDFKIENLDWYVDEGMSEVLSLVESWRI